MRTQTLFRSILILLTACAGLMAAAPLNAEDRKRDDAASSSAAPAVAAKKSSTEEELVELRSLISEQQATIEELTRSLGLLSRKVNASAPAVTVKAASAEPVASPAVITPAPIIESAKPGPLSIRIGDADFTIGGSMDFTAFYRSTNLGSGVGSSFGSLPFSNTPAGNLSETRFTAQKSKVSLKAESKVGGNKVVGFLETDFSGYQPTSGFVTSNANTLRMRLYWVQVQRGKFEVLAGQSWSLLTPNRRGLSPNPSDVFVSQNTDSNYQVGLTFARQAQIRFVYRPTKEWTVGVSAENPEQYLTSAVALPGGSTSSYASQVDIAGSGGATATPNARPDIIVKAAYDRKIAGRNLHVEVAGLLRSFKIFTAGSTGTSSANGVGGSVNLDLEVTKSLRFIVNTFHSAGGGRYIMGLGPDFIIRPNGTPSPVRASSGIAGFEYQLNPSTQIYAYYGGAYFQRNTAIDPATGKPLGFGFSGSSSSSNRSIQEPTFGVTRTFWKNPRFGALQFMNQFSYVTRSPWSVAPGAPKNARVAMFYTNLRYVLP